jgi:tRNA modification GTPase
MMLGSWRIEILDTAGLHEAGDAIEKIGIDHTIEQAETADFFLLMLDANMPSPTLPDSLLRRMNPANTIVVENKTDLPSAQSCADFLPDLQHVSTSLLEGQGLAELRDTWQKSIDASLTNGQNDGVVVNARHAAALGQAVDVLELASAKLKLGEHSELIVADMRDAVEHIGQVVGRVDNERMLDRLFKQFCIGK